MQRDILIIGAGIIGAATSWALAMRGQGERVLLIERESVASGATSRAAALVTLVRDKPWLIPLVQQTCHDIDHLEHELGADVGRHTCGALYAAPAALRQNLLDLAALNASHGTVAQELSPRDAQRLAPWLLAGAFDTAVHFPQEMYIEPYLLTQAYLRAATRLGVQFQDADAVRIHTLNGQVRGLETGTGHFLPASSIVVAAGAWSSLLAAALDIALPMAPVRSQYWITAPADLFDPKGAIMLLPAIRAYARPEGGGLLFGVREQRAVAVDPRRLPSDLSGFVFDPANPDGLDDLAFHADVLMQHIADFAYTGIAHAISGPSCYTPDSHLVLGEADSIRGLFFASGCNGGGIAFCGGMGRAIAELVLQQPVFADIAMHRPQRLGHFDPFSAAFLNRCAASRSNKTSG